MDYVKKWVLVKRGGISASGKPNTRLAFIDRTGQQRTGLRGPILKVGGKDHGQKATRGNVAIKEADIVATWDHLPRRVDIDNARAAIEIVPESERPAPKGLPATLARHNPAPGA